MLPELLDEETRKASAAIVNSWKKHNAAIAKQNTITYCLRLKQPHEVPKACLSLMRTVAHHLHRDPGTKPGLRVGGRAPPRASRHAQGVLIEE